MLAYNKINQQNSYRVQGKQFENLNIRERKITKN